MFAMKHSVVDLGFVCSNFDESLHFYRDLLGMEVVLDIQIPEALPPVPDWHPADSARYV